MRQCFQRCRPECRALCERPLTVFRGYIIIITCNLPVSAAEALLHCLPDKVTVAVIWVPANQRKMLPKSLEIRPVSVIRLSMSLNSRDSRPQSISCCNSDSALTVMTRQCRMIPVPSVLAARSNWTCKRAKAFSKSTQYDDSFRGHTSIRAIWCSVRMRCTKSDRQSFNDVCRYSQTNDDTGG